LVTEKYLSIAQEFLIGFNRECFTEMKNIEEHSLDMAKRHICNGTLYFLEDKTGKIVSMAANVRESQNAATISLVYTPFCFREKGFGSLVTALVSETMLDKGKNFCNLFTDLSNSTSNSIYQKIGYEMIGESKHYKFIRPE